MHSIHDFLKNSNKPFSFGGIIREDEPLSKHTTFKTGGNAGIWVQPEKNGGTACLSFILQFAKNENIPVCVLGRGANMLFGDNGFSGIVLDMGKWSGMENFNTETGRIVFRSGTLLDETVEELAKNSFGSTSASTGGVMNTLLDTGYGGLEFLAGMPGTIGGAVYMNARCYGKSISGCLVSVDALDENLTLVNLPFRSEEWGYKKSPFQNRAVLIVSAEFALYRQEKAGLLTEMERFRKDREHKGHYRYPSAGSVFKNNRSFGKPTGKIIAELGLCGCSRGGAMVAPFHGNIIVNTGGAAASDIRFLVDDITNTVRKRLGFELEPEIVFMEE
jgi:UDP-N-acetylmuramate dehydrogenase